MRKKLYLILTYFLLNFTPISCRETKILVLIIASDQFPIYVEMQKLWRTYMHYDPKHVRAYFIKGDPNLPTLYKFDGDIIWIKTDEGWIPESAGIINKTILSLQALRSKLHTFDYIVRPNLSSFYIFPRLLDFLSKLPKKNVYCGSGMGGSEEEPFASGCGFIISPDVAQTLVIHKNMFIDQKHSPDDALIGHFLVDRGLKRIHHERIDIISLETWHRIKNRIPSTVFHFRVKNADPARRITDEKYIQSQLINMFYS